MELELLLYFAILAAAILSVVAQIRVSTTFNRYSRVATAGGYSAEQVARMVLDSAGCHDVVIEPTRGKLTDHYDPRTKTLRLSEATYHNASAAAIGVACHEAGHAIQHSNGYLPLKLRSLMVPVTNFSSRLWYITVIIGTLFLFIAPEGALGYYMILFGVGLFSVTTLFQLITLPCEFDASARAMRAMREIGYFDRRELSQAKKVLSAAAMTYIASALVSVLQLLRLILIVRRRR